jgi:hypothetical protein
MKIVTATPLPDFRLKLTFDNAEVGVVDLSSLAGRGVFKAWQQPRVFNQVAVTDDGAVEWPGEIDLCPDARYLTKTGKTLGELYPHLIRTDYMPQFRSEG